MGLPAWMPGEPRWAKDGPWRRAHGAGPERGNLSAAKAVRWGEDFLVPFWSLKKGLAVRAKPIAAVTPGMDMYTCKNCAADQAAIASRLTPTV